MATPLWFDFVCTGAGGNMPKRQKNKGRYGYGADGGNAKPATKPAAQPKPSPVIAQATTQN